MNATNRRAVLGAVLAAGAAGATAAIPAPATAAPTFSAIDRRVFDLWNRRRRVIALWDQLHEQIHAAEAQMPEWARFGPKYYRPDGSPAEQSIQVGWPMVADLSRQPVNAKGLINARPSEEDVCREFYEHQSTQDLVRSLEEFAARRQQCDAEEERLGLSGLNQRFDDAQGVITAIEKKIEEQIGTSVFALAATLVVLVEVGRDMIVEDVEGLNRAALKAIRPQLVGLIADDADRVLAQAEEARI